MRTPRPQKTTKVPHENEVGSDFLTGYYKLVIKCIFLEGQMAGRADLILKILAGRFGKIPKRIQTKVRKAPYVLVDKFAERLLTAQTLEQVFERSQ